MQNVFRKLISNKSLAIFTLLLFLLNFLSKVLKESFSVRIPLYPSTVLKLGGVTLLFLYFICYVRTKKIAWYVYTILLVFSIDLLIKVMQDAPSTMLFNRAYFFFKGIFFFLLLVGIKDLGKKELEKPIDMLMAIGKFNLALILIGALFDINIFKSYPHTDRFGFNGIMAEPGISSYMYMLLAIVAYLRYRYQNYNYWTAVFMLIALVFLGTKSAYLFVGIIILIHILYLLKKLVYQLSFVTAMIVTAIILKDKLVQLAINSFNFGTYLYEKHGFLTFITSKRDLLLQDTITYIDENWSIYQYIIGGMDFRKHRVEFEFIDVFLFFGIIGIAVYILALKNLFFTHKPKMLYTVLFLVILLICSLGGNLFFSITNSFCFVIVFLYLNKSLSTTNS
jgi:hypothetical protein